MKKGKVFSEMFFEEEKMMFIYQKEIKRKRGNRLCRQQLPLAALPSSRQA